MEDPYLIGYGNFVLLQHIKLVVKRRELVLNRLNGVLKRLQQLIARVQVVVGFGRHQHFLSILVKVFDQLV